MTSGNRTRCDYCNCELIVPPHAKKNKSGEFYLTQSEYYMPFKCPFCGGYYCGKHRLPENHICKNMPKSYKNTAHMSIDTQVEKSIASVIKEYETTFASEIKNYNLPSKDYSKLVMPPDFKIVIKGSNKNPNKKPSMWKKIKNKLS
jgi:hypothetical protein